MLSAQERPVDRLAQSPSAGAVQQADDRYKQTLRSDRPAQSGHAGADPQRSTDNSEPQRRTHRGARRMRHALPRATAVMAAREAARSAASLDELRAILDGFQGCALRATATQLVFADGNPQARVMFVGEAPGRDEDIAGPAVRRPLRQAAGPDDGAQSGSTATSVYIANIVPWRPPGNRTPTPQETAICLPFILRQIELADPDMLVCLGGPSAQTLLKVKDGISRRADAGFVYRHRHARDPRHRDAASGLSAAAAAAEAPRLARFSRDQKGAANRDRANRFTSTTATKAPR